MLKTGATHNSTLFIQLILQEQYFRKQFFWYIINVPLSQASSVCGANSEKFRYHMCERPVLAEQVSA